MKIADVIVNSSSNELDKSFSYLIPEKFDKTAQIGSRVLVPFGKSNHKVEAYIIKKHDNESEIELKNIFEVLDSSPVINSKMIELAGLMKEKYICTLLDCIKCMIPPGITIKSEKIVTLNQNSNLIDIKNELQKRIINILEDNNYELKYNNLRDILTNDNKISSSINSLFKKGIINVEYKLSSGIQDKVIKVATLCISPDEVQLLIDSMPVTYIAQKRVLELLLDNDYLPVSDLIKFAQTSHSTVNSLVKKGIIELTEQKIDRDPYFNFESVSSNDFELTNEQSEALKAIVISLKNKSKDRFLLHGITGSGKTEVYLKAIEYVIENNGQAIVLVPEISLTPQMIRAFKSRFGEKVAVLHSRLSQGERYDQWNKIKNGEVSVAVGARSAIFAPFDNLKLIIIDEEHENTYKSESKPKYHAKEVALMRSRLENCIVILGSATPAINTYYEALNGEFNLIKMKNRVKDCILPKVEIIDMREELEEGNRSIFSQKLFEEISKNIENNEQTILFLNRRGHSTFVSCRKCGKAIICPNCNIALTYHAYNDMLICHYCGHTEKNPSVCPSCSSKYIKYFGIGTQKIEEEVKKYFPTASVLRMDVDTTGSKFAHQRILDTFEKENINILIGTQMIAKGLNFPNVTLVGIVSADTSLNLDDFRASERTFQLLTQVAGRAGRGERLGRVVVQTYQPESYSILSAQKHDYEDFYENEIAIRKTLEYPPFTDIISIIMSHEDNEIVKKYMYDCEKNVVKYLKNTKYNYIVLKATPAPISRIKQMYRWRLLIKIEPNSNIYEFLKNLQNYYSEKVNINLDINSNNIF